jgi:hypothetical protein
MDIRTQSKKNANIWNKLKKAFATLSSEGMFVEPWGFMKGQEEHSDLMVDCTLYFRDTDDDGNPAGLYDCDANSETLRDENNQCLFCAATPLTPHNILSDMTNRFRCAIKSCGRWAPKSFKRKTYVGIFRIVEGGEAIFVGPSCRGTKRPDGKYDQWGDILERMTNEEQIDSIKRVITKAFE